MMFTMLTSRQKFTLSLSVASNIQHVAEQYNCVEQAMLAFGNRRSLPRTCSEQLDDYDYFLQIRPTNYGH